jgi:PAS domain S-box-containing protein
MARRRISLRALAPVGVALAYYLGAQVGFLLTPAEQPVSTLWPPNALLLGALLFAPTRSWPLFLLATFPAHVAVELHSGVPMRMVLCWFVSNSVEAVIAAGGMRWLAPGRPSLDTFRRVNVFVGCAALFAPFASSFLDAAFVTLNDWGPAGYWYVWRVRFFSNVLAMLTLVPPIIAIGQRRIGGLRSVSRARVLEGLALTTLLLGVCVFVFTGMPAAIHAEPALLYAPLPFLLWAAVRFGPGGASVCLLTFAVLSVWGAIHGHGPFVGYSPHENVLSLQLFLIVTYVPLLALTGVLRERRHTAEEARRSEQQLNLALRAAHVRTWEWCIAADSENYRRFIETIHADDLAVVEAAIARAAAGADAYDIEFRLADDPQRWQQSKGRVIRDDDGVPARMIGVSADVTERKHAEAALLSESMLRESAAQLRELANAMPQIVFTARADGAIDFFNQKWYEFTGTSEAAITDDTWFSMIHPDDANGCIATWRSNVAVGRPHEHEARFRSAKTNAYRWHLVRALPVHADDGSIRRWYGTATDIDDRKRAEDALRSTEIKLRYFGEQLEHRVAERTRELSLVNESLRAEIDVRVRIEKALRASEERFVKAFCASLDAIVISSSPSERIIEVNERWQSMFGYARDEVIGRVGAELGIGPDANDETRLRGMMAVGGCIREVEVDIRNRRGERLRAVLSRERLDVAGESCYITMLRDVTERRRAEQVIAAQRRQLAHLGRVAVLGELSGALAHELNQPLTAILANARAAQRLLARPRIDAKEISDILDDIASDDLRAGAVIRRMRDLIRNGDTAPQLTDANDVVREVLDIAHGDLMLREVMVTTRLSPSLPSVPADRVQLQQVLLNLIVNACDAMADNPRGDRMLVISSARDSTVVRLSVSDHGTGIPTEPVELVFEPFRTTKEHGLGLGLSICRSIVAAHGGKMWAVNNQERGATFHLALPIERELAS